MTHIKLPQFEDMTPAIDEKVYFATYGMIQRYLLDKTTLSYDSKESLALLISVENGCKGSKIL